MAFKGLKNEQEGRFAKIERACQDSLPHLAKKGIDLFDQGEFFEAHEELELAWRAEPGPARNLYQGILQIGIAYLHTLRGNYRGARKMFNRAKAVLDGLPDQCQEIDLRQFRTDYKQVEAAVTRLGARNLHQFDRTMLRPVPRINTLGEEHEH